MVAPSSVVSGVSVSVLPQLGKSQGQQSRSGQNAHGLFRGSFHGVFPHFFLVFILLLVSDKYSLPAFG